MLNILFNKRSIAGTLLLLILIGEVNVASTNLLFTINGFLFLIILYFTLYHLYESLIVRFKLNYIQVALVSFVLYSVFLAGFINAELLKYRTINPDPTGTNAIRVHTTVFAPMVFYFLDKYFPRKQRSLGLKLSLSAFLVYMLIISFSGVVGFANLFRTLSLDPVVSLIFIFLSFLAILLIPRLKSELSNLPHNKLLIFSIWLSIFIGLIPATTAFTVLVFFVSVVGVLSLFFKKIRDKKL